MNNSVLSSNGLENSFLDYFTFLIHKWKFIVISIIIGVLVFVGFGAISIKEDSYTKLSYLLIPKELVNNTNQDMSKVLGDAINLLQSDKIEKEVMELSSIDKNTLEESVEFNQDFSSNTFNLEVKNSNKNVTEKITSAYKITILKELKADSYFGKVSLIKDENSTEKSKELNKAIIIIAILPFILVIAYFSIIFLKKNPLVSKKNLIRIFPKVLCDNLNLNEIESISLKLSCLLGSDKVTNFELMNLSDNEFNEIVSFIAKLKLNGKENLIYILDENYKTKEAKIDNVENNENINHIDVKKFQELLINGKLDSIQNNQNIITIENCKLDNSVGFWVSSMTDNNVIVLGTKEKKKNIPQYFKDNLKNPNEIKYVLLYDNMY